MTRASIIGAGVAVLAVLVIAGASYVRKQELNPVVVETPITATPAEIKPPIPRTETKTLPQKKRKVVKKTKKSPKTTGPRRECDERGYCWTYFS